MELKRYDFTPILGWSVSRYDLFKLCKRQYFYTYYGKFDNDHPFSKIKELKFMTSIPLEIGNITHDIIKSLLEKFQKSGIEIDGKKFLKYVEDTTNKYCDSKIFIEVYYNGLKNIDKNEILEKVKKNLSNFLKSERYRWIKDKAIKTKDDWLIEPDGFGETRLNDLKAYCKVDFLFPINDKLYILDWKTGKKDEFKHNKQMFGYSAWANSHFNYSANKIMPIIIYLNPIFEEKTTKIDNEKIEEFKKQIQNETNEMYVFCKEITKNIPIEKIKFQKNISNMCHYCKFRDLCEKDED